MSDSNIFLNNKALEKMFPLNLKLIPKKWRGEDLVVMLCKKRFSNTRIKAKDFLTNVDHSHLNQEDSVNRPFTCNVVTLLSWNIDPFSLQWKFVSQNDQRIVTFA